MTDTDLLHDPLRKTRIEDCNGIMVDNQKPNPIIAGRRFYIQDNDQVSAQNNNLHLSAQKTPHSCGLCKFLQIALFTEITDEVFSSLFVLAFLKILSLQRTQGLNKIAYHRRDCEAYQVGVHDNNDSDHGTVTLVPSPLLAARPKNQNQSTTLRGRSIFTSQARFF